MKRTFVVILMFLLFTTLTMAQRLTLRTSEYTVCVGSDITLSLDYGSATSVVWEYSTNGYTYKTLSTDLTTTLTTTLLRDQNYYYRVTSGTGTSKIVSNIVRVRAVSPYIPNWTTSGRPVMDNEWFAFCGEDPFTFTYTINGDKQAHNERYSSTWMIDGVVMAHTWSFDVPLIHDQMQVVHIVDDKYCPASVMHFNMAVTQMPEIELETDKILLCEGSELTVKAIAKNAPAVILLVDYDSKETYLTQQLSSEQTVLKPTESGTYLLFVPESEVCPSVTSNEIYVEVEKNIHQDKWNYGNKLLESGEVVEYCGPVEDLYFNYFNGRSKEDSLYIVQHMTSQWLYNGVEVSSDFNYTLSSLESSGTLTHIVSPRVCPASTFDFAFDVEPTPSATLALEDPLICEGSTTNLLLTTKDAKTITVYDLTNNSMAQYTAPMNKIPVSPSENTRYKVSVKGLRCESETEPVTLNVQEQLKFTQTPEDTSICNGETVFAKASASREAEFKWTNRNTLLSLDEEMSDTPEATTTYIVEANDGLCPPIEATMQVEVIQQPSVSVENVSICEGGEAKFRAKGESDITYRWYDDKELTSLLSQNASLNISPLFNTTYYLEASRNGRCPIVKEAEVLIGSIPTVVGHSQLSSTLYRLDVEGGTGTIYYDFGNGEPVTEPTLANAQANRTYVVTLRDELGCTSTYEFETNVYEIKIPEYFVATREKWLVENLDKFEHIRVDIYDRWGKLLVTTTDPLEGWDGTYHNIKMPSTDYWYVISIADTDRQYSGHFTLLRE